ncbi:MAG: ABC transporter ATP-binding protein/permease [Lachnospiraceae bacterium]|nr:ABC transporter ATP-binding protein/permease [Lachnospiraceae bacterium]
MPDNTQRPGDINEYSGLNKLFKSKAVQFIINKVDDGTFSEFFDDWKWIFSFSRKYKRVIIFYTILGIVSSSLSLVSSVASKYMIDIITGYQFSKLWLLALVMVGSTVISLVFSSLVSRISVKISIYVNNDIQATIFDQIIDADWLKLSQYQNGDLLNRFNSDVSTVASNAVSWLPNLIIAIYNFIATFCVIFYYDMTMAWIALSSAPFLLLASRFLMRKNKEYRQRVLEMNSGMMSFEAETFYNMDTIKSFGVMDHYSKGLRGWQEKYKKYNLDYNMFSIKTNIGMNILATIVSFVSFGYCLFRLWTGDITYGTMTLFLNQRSKLTTQFNSLVSVIPGMLNSSVSAHRIRELIQLPREKHLPEESEQMAKAAENGFEVRMSGVDFAYVEDNKVLRESDFIARLNEIVALVGPSGEGKTTMIRMVLGLIHPGAGEVSLVDKDGNEVEINADTRRYFAYVPQGNTILSGTVAENMRMVKEDATDEEIIEALKTACAWEFVSKLPEGINGKLGERGRGVSEGQAQRIAIARAVLRDAPVLLLDEATSALDVQTERQVLRSIIQQRPNKTIIVTTHRPSVLDMCQRVYRVMDTKLTELDEEASAKMVMDF